MKLSFSTLACPEWTWQQAVEAAQALGYEGIEWRMIDATLVSAAFPVETCRAIKARMQAAGLASCAVDASIQLAVPPGDARRAMIEEAHGMLRLAGELGTRMLRVFIGKYPPQTPESVALDWVRDGLSEILPDAQERGIKVALEVHSFEGRGKNVNGTSDSSMCRRTAESLRSRALGILWDLGNPYAEGETLTETWLNVKDHLLYLHVKDLKVLPGGPKYVLNGEGDVELPKIIGLLKKSGFDGWLSYEWEKKWHPELAGADVSLPHYITSMRALLQEGAAGR